MSCSMKNVEHDLQLRSDTGMSLKLVLDSMEKWGKEYKNKFEE